jgi:hypothetical protein
LSVGPTGPNQKAYFVKFSLPVNFVVLIRVAYGSGSGQSCTATGSNRTAPGARQVMQQTAIAWEENEEGEDMEELAESEGEGARIRVRAGTREEESELEELPNQQPQHL